MTAELDLFDATGVTLEGRKWRWHVMGRYLVVIDYGWPVSRPKRQVWHFEDDCIAATEEEARAHFTRECGEITRHNQWQMCQGAEIKPLRKGRG